MGWATYWAMFSQTHLVTLVHVDDQSIKICSKTKPSKRKWSTNSFVIENKTVDRFICLRQEKFRQHFSEASQLFLQF
jgi:hypothetical protein